MAEPVSLEEAYERYVNKGYSRRDLFGFVVERIKAGEERIAQLEMQNRELVSALVRGVQEPPPTRSPVMVPADSFAATLTDEERQQLRQAAPGEVVLVGASKPTQSERMKKYWADRKAQAVADGVGASNG